MRALPSSPSSPSLLATRPRSPAHGRSERRRTRCGTVLLAESQSPTSTAASVPLPPAETAPVIPKLTLYGHPGTRSPLINWACHELGIMESWVEEATEMSQNPHPFGQLPCLVVSHRTKKGASIFDRASNQDEGKDVEVIFESGAILQYLYLLYLQHDENPSMGKVYDTGLRADPKNRKLRRLDDLLSRQPYLLGNEFTVADVAVASYLLYVVQFFPDVDLTPWPAVKAYMKACASRPSYRKAFGERVASYLVGRLA